MNPFFQFWQREAKYLLAYLILILPFAGLLLKSYGVFLTPLILFGLLPLVELLAKGNPDNHSESEADAMLNNRLYDFLLYANLPLLYTLLGYYFWTIGHDHLFLYEHVGLALSVGIACGAIGINVAHELGHRKKPYERSIAKGLLLASLYMHFYIEHNRGHHRFVATRHDPATARLGETVYAFWLRSVVGGYFSAWNLEKRRLLKAGHSPFSWENQMLRFQLIQLAALVAVGLVFSWQAMLAYLAVSLIGILLLETVNYLEHYGLTRKEIRPDVYEPVKPQHSWNSNHSLGRIMLYELTRHADHHYRASRKYQVLRHHNDSPELPTGYPGMMLLALVPPLWFRTMDARVKRAQPAVREISPS